MTLEELLAAAGPDDPAARAKAVGDLRHIFLPGGRATALARAAEAAADDDEAILIYGIVGDEWDGLHARAVVDRIRALKSDVITLRINSPGGLVFDGLTIYNALRADPRPVTVHVDGLAASMASIIAMAGDRIVMPENALMMIHNPRGIEIGEADALRKYADALDKIADGMARVYARRTGQAVSDIAAMMASTTWLNADEAVAQGFAHETDDPVDASALTLFDVSAMRNAPSDFTRLAAGPVPDMPPPAEPSASQTLADPSASQAKDTTMTIKTHDGPEDKKPVGQTAQTDTAIADARRAEKERQKAIRAAVANARLADHFAAGEVETFTAGLIDGDLSVADAHARIIDKLAEADGPATVTAHRASVTHDALDRFMEGASQAIIARAGHAGLMARARATATDDAERARYAVDPGGYRGHRLVDMAREYLEIRGQSARGLGPDGIVKAALSFEGALTQSTSDFVVLLENTMHKILLAAYATQPDTWSRWCATGSVTDFRPHNRYRLGSFGKLDPVAENGEFKNKTIPDAEKELISAASFGNIINITRQMIVNDDLGAFERMVLMLGRAAKLSVEIDAYAALVSNAGMGPVLNDGLTLFHADHNNLGTSAGAPTVERFDDARVVMASQKDPSSNEFLHILPSLWLGPLALGGTARVLNDAQYDPDTTNKLQKPNMVRGIVSDIVDTPRLTGNPWYLFADPTVAPVMEVVFLNGEQSPRIEMKESFRTDGAQWRVAFDYGVGGVDFRGAVRNAGG